LQGKDDHEDKMSELAVKPGPTAQPGRGFLPPADLAPGDRFPNFVLPDQTGAARSFLERARGNPILLIGDSDDAGLQSVEQADLGATGVDAMALVPELPEAAARRAEQLNLGLPLLGDSAGKIREALRRMLGVGPRGAFAVLLDGNQRVTEVRADPDNAALVAWAIERSRALPPPEAGAYVNGVAPVLLVPNVLTPAQCRALIDRWHQLGSEEGHVYSIVKGEESRRIDKSMKSRRDHRIMDEALMQELATLVGRRVGPELNKAFGFGKFRFDRFVVTCYDAERGDFFRRHRDNEAKATADRRFALTLNLNSEEYEGGGLIFPEYGPHRYNPPTGGAILFSCSLLHEALPIAKGRRFTLLNFLRS
jgi:predicted 2-oxoglutarate/Fe(II)-dependent dioxygenase YbiX/peroxiredoxin